ncbi:MAG: HAMP domain-containing sensor histidine kinase, partial [Calditrichaceae bacterium]
RILAEQKNIKLNLDLTDININTCGKQEDFAKVFSNIINNAIRYSPEGSEVGICLKTNDKIIIFEVKDNGIGIPENEISKIFEEFYRAESAKKIVNFGTGLGLSLSKQIVENYDGKISVTSKVAQGSTFKVTIPIKTC